MHHRVGAARLGRGVLDVDSDLPAAFTAADQDGIEAICAELGRRYG